MTNQPCCSEEGLLRGTLTTFRRRCGTQTCRCAAGEPHESPALTYTEDGRTKTLTLPHDEVEAVAAAVERYKTARAELDARADAGIAALRARLAARRRSRRR